MKPRAHAGLGRVEQVAHPGLDEHGLEPRHVEQLIAGHPRNAPVDFARLRPLAQPVVRLHETDDLVVLGSPVDGQLARVGMAHADLADLDARRSRCRRRLLAMRQVSNHRRSEETRRPPHQRPSAPSVHRLPPVRQTSHARVSPRRSTASRLHQILSNYSPTMRHRLDYRRGRRRQQGRRRLPLRGLLFRTGRIKSNPRPSRSSRGDSMLKLLGNPKRLCNGLSRRDLLHIGGLGAFGFALADDLSLRRAQAEPASTGSGFGRARSCILIYKYGSPPQHETFDPKPEAPAEVRGELKAIPTSVPGVQICDHLPKIARIMDRLTVVRSLTHPYPLHGTVYATTGAYGLNAGSWDTHHNHFARLKDYLLPVFDQAFSALILDLEQRGLLDETLVLVISEHGRTPMIDRKATGGGRDHWSRAYSQVYAGGGMGRGNVVGATDRLGGDVVATAVSPKDILATAFYLLGIDPDTTVPDREGRPRRVAGDGVLRRELLG